MNDRVFAVIRDPDEEIHLVSHGDHLGTNFGEITAISKDLIELVEVVLNDNGDFVSRDARIELQADQTAAMDALAGPPDDFALETDRRREELEDHALDSLTLVGTLETEDSQWAIIKDGTGKVHRVQVGNYMGRDFGKITALEPGFIELEEVVWKMSWEARDRRMFLVNNAYQWHLNTLARLVVRAAAEENRLALSKMNRLFVASSANTMGHAELLAWTTVAYELYPRAPIAPVPEEYFADITEFELERAGELADALVRLYPAISDKARRLPFAARQLLSLEEASTFHRLHTTRELMPRLREVAMQSFYDALQAWTALAQCQRPHENLKPHLPIDIPLRSWQAPPEQVLSDAEKVISVLQRSIERHQFAAAEVRARKENCEDLREQ